MSILTSEALSYIGRETEPVTEVIDPWLIRNFARAICYPEPPDTRWTGREAAAPFHLPVVFLEHAALEPSGLAPPLPPTPQALKAGNEYEVLRPVRAGDVLTIRHRLAELREREGRSGVQVFTTTETTAHDPSGDLVFRVRTIMVRIYPREAGDA